MKIFVTFLLAISMVSIAGTHHYASKPIIREIKETKSPKFGELIEIDDVFKRHISIGDDEHAVLKIIKKNGFKYSISEKDIITDHEKVYKIIYSFENPMMPNGSFVIGKLYFKDEKLIFYKTAYVNTMNKRTPEYY